MAIHRHVILICVVVGAVAFPKPNRSIYESRMAYPFTFVSRDEWGARPSGTAVSPLDTPVPFVVIHHSHIPSDCSSRDSCMENMHYIQDLHQITNGWQDIGYNFAVGGDGAVYEGRGWETVGAHAVGYNSKSIGIVLIGDFISHVPPVSQTEVTRQLIAVGVELGYISQDYEMIGHRQVTATECPGDALYEEISTWENFVPTVSAADKIN